MTGKITKLYILLFFSISITTAQSNIRFSNYGPEASSQEGDDDYYSVYYIKINEDVQSKVYLRLFDMDCGGEIDQQFNNWDTQTKFTLYNHDFVYKYSDISGRSFEKETLMQGDVLKEEIVGWSETLDDSWHTFAELEPTNGTTDNDSHLFKLVVKTTYGNDGNLYELFLSSSPDQNIPVEGAEIFFYKPNFRLLDTTRYGYFKLSNTDSPFLTVSNFDGDGSPLRLHTPLRSNLKLTTSRQDNWKDDKVNFNEFENTLSKAIQFYGREAGPNDITFFVLDFFGQPVAMTWQVNPALNNVKPVLKYTYSNSVEGLDYTFDCSKSYDPDGDKINFLWYVNGRQISEDEIFEYKFPSPGKYNITLIGFDNSGSPENGSIKEFSIIVNAQPVAIAGDNIFSTDPKLYFNATKSFDNGGQITRYLWDFGDGYKDNNPITNHTYRSPGKYEVLLKVWDDSKSGNNFAVDTLNVTINAKPIADAGPNVLAAPGQVIMLSGRNSIDTDGTIQKYEWTYKDSIKLERDISLVFNQPGIYKAKLKVYDDSGHKEASDSDEITITINDAPVSIINAPKVVAPDHEFNINSQYSSDPDGKITAYEWNIGDFTSDKSELTYKLDSPGLYDVTLKVKDNYNLSNSYSENTFTIKVNSSPTPVIEYNELSCDTYITFDGSKSIDNDGDNLYFVWDFGNGIKKPGKVVAYDFMKSGNYPITLTIDDGQQVSNSIVKRFFTVQINEPPVSNAGEDVTACVGRKVFLTGIKSSDAEGGALKYFWDFGDGTTSQGLNVTKAYEKPGLYQVELKVIDNSGLPCNYDIDTKLISVVEAPVANAGSDITGCTNKPVHFDAKLSTDTDGIVNSYFWDFGDGNTGGGSEPDHIYTESGIYTVTLTVTGEYNGNCSNSDSDQLKVNIVDAVTASIVAPDSVSINCPCNFASKFGDIKPSPNSQYQWKINGDNISQQDSFTKTFDKPGNYVAELTIDQQTDTGCGLIFVQKNIYVNAPPVANAGKDIQTSTGTLIHLDASESFDKGGNIRAYIWQFEDGTIKEGKHITHIFSTPGGYTIKLTVFDDTNLKSNSDEDEVFILVSPYKPEANK